MNKIAKKEKFNPYFIPIIAALLIVPLLIRYVNVNLSFEASSFFGESNKIDLLSMAKTIALYIITIGVVIITIFTFKKIITRLDLNVKIYLICSGVFILFTLISSIFAYDKQSAFFGIFNRAEGFFTIFCYILLFLYTFYTYQTSSDYRYIVYALLTVIVITSFLGVFQYFGNDLLATEFGKKLIVPASKIDSVGDISLLYSTGKLYGTFFHYNYVGSFTAIVIPLLLTLIVFIKDIKTKIVLSIGGILSMWLLFGSTSRAGIIGICGAFLFGILFFGKVILKKWKPLVISLCALVVLAIGLNALTSGKIFERIPALIKDIGTGFKSTGDFNYLEHIPITDIKQADGKISIKTQTDEINISYDGENYNFSDKNNNKIDFVIEKNKFSTTDARFAQFQFLKTKDDEKTPKMLLFCINNVASFYFDVTEENAIRLVDCVTFQPTELVNAPSVGFNGKEKIGSARGYIWSRCIPMLKDNILIGSGPDSFIFEFPQNDLLGKLWAYDTPNMIVDKPHNIFIQLFLSCGGIAFLAFMTIIITYIVDCFKLYAFKKEYSTQHILGAGTCLAIIGYLFAGLFNDSIVAVATIFWILLGAGIAINFKVRHETDIPKATDTLKTAKSTKK